MILPVLMSTVAGNQDRVTLLHGGLNFLGPQACMCLCLLLCFAHTAGLQRPWDASLTNSQHAPTPDAKRPSTAPQELRTETPGCEAHVSRRGSHPDG